MFPCSRAVRTTSRRYLHPSWNTRGHGISIGNPIGQRPHSDPKLLPTPTPSLFHSYPLPSVTYHRHPDIHAHDDRLSYPGWLCVSLTYPIMSTCIQLSRGNRMCVLVWTRHLEMGDSHMGIPVFLAPLRSGYMPPRLLVQISPFPPVPSKQHAFKLHPHPCPCPILFSFCRGAQLHSLLRGVQEGARYNQRWS